MYGCANVRRVRAGCKQLQAALEAMDGALESGRDIYSELQAVIAASDELLMTTTGVSETPEQVFARVMSAWRTKMFAGVRIKSYNYVRALLPRARAVAKALGRADADARKETCARLEEAATAADAFDESDSSTFEELKAALKQASRCFNEMADEVLTTDSDTDSDTVTDSDRESRYSPPCTLTPEIRLRCFQVRLRMEGAVNARAGAPFRERVNAMTHLSPEDRDALRQMYFTVSSGCHAGSSVEVDDDYIDAVERKITDLFE